MSKYEITDTNLVRTINNSIKNFNSIDHKFSNDNNLVDSYYRGDFYETEDQLYTNFNRLNLKALDKDLW